MTDRNSVLAPCPCCQSTAIASTWVRSHAGMVAWSRCLDCGIEGPEAAWNRRALKQEGVEEALPEPRSGDTPISNLPTTPEELDAIKLFEYGRGYEDRGVGERALREALEAILDGFWKSAMTWQAFRKFAGDTARTALGKSEGE